MIDPLDFTMSLTTTNYSHITFLNLFIQFFILGVLPVEFSALHPPLLR